MSVAVIVVAAFSAGFVPIAVAESLRNLFFYMQAILHGP
jgi:hypothetical protein